MPALPLIVCDVNETLLDLNALTPHFERLFGDARAMREWFNQVVLYSGALSLTGDYADFGEIGGSVLRMVGATRGVEVSASDALTLKEAIAAMPPHPEVPAALARLRNEGFRIFALTNNPRATCIHQLRAAGIHHVFEDHFSIDDAYRRYKPAPEAYRAVEEALGLPPSRFLLIACHAWDTMGATAAGWEAALIRREGNAPISLGRQPGIVGRDLAAVAESLIERSSGLGEPISVRPEPGG